MSWYKFARSRVFLPRQAQTQAAGTTYVEWFSKYWPVIRDLYGLGHLERWMDRDGDGNPIPPGVEAIDRSGWDGTIEGARPLKYIAADFRTKPFAATKGNEKTTFEPGEVDLGGGESIYVGSRHTLESQVEDIRLNPEKDRDLYDLLERAGGLGLVKLGKVMIRLNRGCGRAKFVMDNRDEPGMLMEMPDPTDPSRTIMVPTACYTCPDVTKDNKACYSMVISQKYGKDATGTNVSESYPLVSEEEYAAVADGMENLTTEQLMAIRGRMDLSEVDRKMNTGQTLTTEKRQAEREKLEQILWENKLRSLLRIDYLIKNGRAELAQGFVASDGPDTEYRSTLPAMIGVVLDKEWSSGKAKDARSGVNSDGSAWCHPYSLLGIARGGLNSWTCISSCYYPPPPNVDAMIGQLRGDLAPGPDAFDDTDPRHHLGQFTPDDEDAIRKLRDRTVITVSISGWHSPREIEHRVAWLRDAKANGWNVVARFITDSEIYDTRDLALKDDFRDRLMASESERLGVPIDDPEMVASMDQTLARMTELIQPIYAERLPLLDSAGEQLMGRNGRPRTRLETDEELMAKQDVRRAEVDQFLAEMVANGTTWLNELRGGRKLNRAIRWVPSGRYGHQDEVALANISDDKVGWKDRFPNQFLVLKVMLADLLNHGVPIMENPFHFGQTYAQPLFSLDVPSCCNNFEYDVAARTCINCPKPCGRGLQDVGGKGEVARKQLANIDAAVARVFGDIDDGVPEDIDSLVPPAGTAAQGADNSSGIGEGNVVQRINRRSVEYAERDPRLVAAEYIVKRGSADDLSAEDFSAIPTEEEPGEPVEGVVPEEEVSPDDQLIQELLDGGDETISVGEQPEEPSEAESDTDLIQSLMGPSGYDYGPQQPQQFGPMLGRPQVPAPLPPGQMFGQQPPAEPLPGQGDVPDRMVTEDVGFSKMRSEDEGDGGSPLAAELACILRISQEFMQKMASGGITPEGKPPTAESMLTPLTAREQRMENIARRLERRGRIVEAMRLRALIHC